MTGFFKFINVDDLERPWTPKKEFRFNISTINCDEMAGEKQDNICRKFSALNVDFSNSSSDPLGL